MSGDGESRFQHLRSNVEEIGVAKAVRMNMKTERSLEKKESVGARAMPSALASPIELPPTHKLNPHRISHPPTLQVLPSTPPHPTQIWPPRRKSSAVPPRTCSWVLRSAKVRFCHPRRYTTPKQQLTITGELVFGVARIFASFNDTFVHVTDLSYV